MHKRFDVRSLVSSAAVQLPPSSFLQPLQPQAWCRCHLFPLTTPSIIMFSKAVLTLLTIGALSVNVSATPIPIAPRSLPLDTEMVEKRGVFGTTGMDKSTKIARELSRSFSALSYCDLTFVFSVVGVGIPATLLAAGGGILAGVLQNKQESQNARREPELESESLSDYVAPFKREPASDEALHYLYPLSGHEPEPVLPF